MKKALTHLRQADARLGALIGRVGPCRIEYQEPVFSSLARSIVFQQLNARAASAIHQRLEKACAGAVSPERILKLRPSRLRALGISPQKSGYLKDLARRSRDGEIGWDTLGGLPDASIVEILTRVKGVGVWTAHMFLIFALRRPDVLPTGDYGIRAAMRNLYGLEDLPTPAEMERMALPWRPYASVACWYLWRSLDGPA